MKLDRMSVRALAERDMEELQAVSNAGGNTHQKSLDLQDRIKELASIMSPDEATAFMNMYIEECDACERKIRDDISVLLSKRARTTDAVSGFIVLLVLFFILKWVFA